MSKKCYVVCLEAAERAVVHGRQDLGGVDIHTGTVKSVRQRFVEEGLESALDRKQPKNPPRSCKFDSVAEARLIATVPPRGWAVEVDATAAVGSGRRTGDQ